MKMSIHFFHFTVLPSLHLYLSTMTHTAIYSLDKLKFITVTQGNLAQLVMAIKHEKQNSQELIH